MDKTFNVLFLCTGNSSRSIMAEALMNTLGRGKFTAYSAGSHPTGEVHPLALELARSIKYPTEDLSSKSWDEFSEPGAPVMDFVFTVCDKAAGEQCPFWPGQPMTAHWGFSDPAAVQGSDDIKRKAFLDVFQQIRSRVQLLISLPLEKLDRIALQNEVDRIGTSLRHLSRHGNHERIDSDQLLCTTLNLDSAIRSPKEASPVKSG